MSLKYALHLAAPERQFLTWIAGSLWVPVSGGVETGDGTQLHRWP